MLSTFSLVMSCAPHFQGQSTGNFGQISKCNWKEKQKTQFLVCPPSENLARKQFTQLSKLLSTYIALWRSHSYVAIFTRFLAKYTFIIMAFNISLLDHLTTTVRTFYFNITAFVFVVLDKNWFLSFILHLDVSGKKTRETIFDQMHINVCRD
jgi:hypothetical protein